MAQFIEPKHFLAALTKLRQFCTCNGRLRLKKVSQRRAALAKFWFSKE